MKSVNLRKILEKLDFGFLLCYKLKAEENNVDRI